MLGLRNADEGEGGGVSDLAGERGTGAMVVFVFVPFGEMSTEIDREILWWSSRRLLLLRRPCLRCDVLYVAGPA